MVLATNGGRGEPRMASLLRPRLLELERLWMVLEFTLLVGMGAVPLWQLVPWRLMRLGLGAGNHLGARMGDMAIHGQPLRLGSFAAGLRLALGCRTYLQWFARLRWLRLQLRLGRLLLCPARVHGPSPCPPVLCHRRSRGRRDL